MNSLKRTAPRPRGSVRIPSYPALIVASAAALTGCAAAPASQRALAASPEPEVAVVTLGTVAEQQPGSTGAPDNPPAPSPEAPWRSNPGTYPNDNAQVAIGCGGGCPPAWQLEADYRDRRQIEARVQHCHDLVGSGRKGRIQVSVQIDQQGHARSVLASHTGEIPNLVDECISELLGGVQYQATNNYARTASLNEEYPKPVTVRLPKRGQ